MYDWLATRLYSRSARAIGSRPGYIPRVFPSCGYRANPEGTANYDPPTLLSLSLSNDWLTTWGYSLSARAIGLREKEREREGIRQGIQQGLQRVYQST
eukprot:6678244-Pyramimonas_sp.AAC.1